MADSTSPANVFAQMKSGAPTISIPSSPPDNTSPANVFAQMKSGTFATGNEASNPQLAGPYSTCSYFATCSPCAKDKYDALRANRKPIRDMLWYCLTHKPFLALAMQPTGYVGYPGTNYQPGFSGY
jgi:hypothetical protein